MTIKTICAHCNALIKDGDTPDGLVSHGICDKCKWRLLAPVPVEHKKTKMLKSLQYFYDVLDGYEREAIRNAYKRVERGNAPQDDLECYIALFACKAE